MKRIYQLTERDRKTAADKADQARARLAEIESRKSDVSWWKRRRTTYGLAKRDASRQALRGELDYYEGRGQGLLDQIQELPYAEERRSAAYNAGYHDGFLGSLNELHGYLQQNANFDFMRESTAVIQLRAALAAGADCAFALHDALLEDGKPELAEKIKL